MKRIPESHWKYIYIALTINLVLRVILFFAVYPDDKVLRMEDQHEYITLAETIAKSGFDENFGTGRTPFYPLFLFICFKFTNSLFFPIIIQHLTGMFSIILCYLSGLFFSERIALAALFWSAFSFNSIILSNYILTDALYYLTFCMIFMLTIRYSAQDSRLSDAALSGILIGVSILNRPVSIYLPICFVFFFFARHRKNFRKAFFHSSIFLLSVILLVLPWLARNKQIYGSYALTNFGHYQLISWIIPGVMMGSQNISYLEAQKISSEEWEKEKSNLSSEIKKNPFEIDRIGKTYALKKLWSFPLKRLIIAWTWGAARNMFTPEVIELSHLMNWKWSRFAQAKGENYFEKSWNFLFKNENSWYSVFFCLGCIYVLLLRIIQLFGILTMTKQHPLLSVFFLISIAYFLVLMGPYGSPKYRLPFELLLILYSAFGTERLMSYYKKTLT
ncbi:MAG: glycosyltransferase family 39 protein [Candidatus Riflebacteria bacterium]|nr:glycosyltransferase family 39 protein [Candidatus Riflebacteria bacterium]